jgi:hypothetical protein
MPANKTPASVRDALNAAFLTHFEAAGESRAIIAWDSEEFDTTSVTAFVRFGFQANLGTRAALGAGTSQFVRRFGIVSAVVYVRKGQPVARRDALTEIVMDFLEDPEFSAAGVSLEEPGFDDLGLVDGWNQVNCTAQGRYDLIRTA